jgi:hypothetical protein
MEEELRSATTLTAEELLLTGKTDEEELSGIDFNSAKDEEESNAEDIADEEERITDEEERATPEEEVITEEEDI